MPGSESSAAAWQGSDKMKFAELLLPGMATHNLLLKQLVEFGLSEKEARVYLALLELEVAAVSEIAKTADINRSSAYVVLESLKKKGLVSVSEDKKIQNYVAVSPELLIHEAENRAKKAEDLKNKINNILSELKALHKDTRHRPKARVFEGKQGLINAFEDTLQSKEKFVRVASSGEKILKNLPDYFPDWLQRRAELGIKMHGIHPNDKTVSLLMKMSPKFDKHIVVPPKKYKLPADIGIYDDKIGFMSFEKDLMAISIENKEMAEVMKSIFDLAFEEAKRLSKK